MKYGSYYHIYPKYSDRHTWADREEPDQMLQNAASDQGLHCLPLSHIQHTNRYMWSTMDLFTNLLDKYIKKIRISEYLE